MYKKLIKSVIICVSVVFFTLMLGYIAYYGAVSILNRSVNDSGGSAEAVSSNAVPKPDPTPAPSAGTGEYLARLNGDNIEIYRRSGTDENLMYSFRVYPGGIPSDDLEQLRRGIIFRTREELAAFEEDYNS